MSLNYDAIVLDCAPIRIGDDVSIGPRAQLLTALHPMDEHELRRQRWETAAPITIGDNVWLGGGVIVCPGVTIGANAIIGAGSVVTRDAPPRVFAAGNPCRWCGNSPWPRLTLTLGQPRTMVVMTSRINDISVSGGESCGVHRLLIQCDCATVSVSRGGRGRPVVLCPGLYSTQAGLQVLIELLRRDHKVVTFDLRGHGLSSGAARYSFAGFLGDLSAVMAAARIADPAPVLVGYSLGADLAVHYAVENPGAVAGLVLVDGANPIPEPFLSPADMAEFRAMWEKSVQVDVVADAAQRVLLTASQVLDLNLELDAIRTGPLLGRYRSIDVPIRMIMSNAMAGNGADERTRWRNRNWRAGIERLSRERPDIPATWLDADHQLVVTHAGDIARIVADHIGRLPDPED